MKRQFLLFGSFLFIQAAVFSQSSTWHIAGDHIKSPWADSVNVNNVLPDYPRPLLQRSNWTNLNGLWQYAILPKDQQSTMPSVFQGNILVPFAVESALSGVAKTVGKDSVLWYKRSIVLPSNTSGKTVLLHFGAIDWQSDIYVNGTKITRHEGGYDPFTVDITSALKKGTKQDLAVCVWDPTTDGPQPRGKQVKDPEGIWYTPVTGIWQTVWLEAVSKTYISSTKQTPDVDNSTLDISAHIEGMQAGDALKFTAMDAGKTVSEQTVTDTAAKLAISNPVLWSPNNPHLYDLKVSLLRKGKVVDEVKSYFAMRKSSLAKDKNGVMRMMLNNEFIFQYGPLDQGWWPDGLYTAPTDAALKYDIEQTKAMGFNMIRKHIKVEPARWYRYCDEIGIVVWQDMPSGDLGNRWDNRPGVMGRATDQNRTAESEGYYRKEWNVIMDELHNYPCIVVWTPFNEAWGQFKTIEIADWTKKKDPSRLVNSASGGNFFTAGDILDLHSYPDPAMPLPQITDGKEAVVCGEFGGLGLPLDEHTWQQKNWGYQTFKNSDTMFMRYKTLTDKLAELIPHGLSAAVYTQTTDVEGEVNGFMTYDRKVMKMPLDKLSAENKRLYTIKAE